MSLRGLALPLIIRTPDVHFLDMERWAESKAGLRRLYWRAQAKRFRISPIASGTGIKMKTLDAMAHGKAMIGLRNAFRGVPVENGLQAMIADSPSDFARLFEELIDDEPRRRTIGFAARDLVRTHFDPAILGERLAAVYARCRLR